MKWAGNRFGVLHVPRTTVLTNREASASFPRARHAGVAARVTYTRRFGGDGTVVTEGDSTALKGHIRKASPDSVASDTYAVDVGG